MSAASWRARSSRSRTWSQPGSHLLLSFVIAFEYEQLVETECRDHQRRANQERVHDDLEQAKAAADMGRLPEDARGCPDDDVGAIDEGSGGVEEQEDYRDQHQKPGQGKQALESALHRWHRRFSVAR